MKLFQSLSDPSGAQMGLQKEAPPLVVHWICLYLLLFNPSREEPSASINQVQEDLCSAGKPWYPVLQVLLAASADAQGCSSKLHQGSLESVRCYAMGDQQALPLHSSWKASGDRIIHRSEWGFMKEQRREQAVHTEVLAGERRVTLGGRAASGNLGVDNLEGSVGPHDSLSV